jgi:hypothetical protein
MKHGWTKNAFWYVNNKKWRKWCKIDSPYIFNNFYGLLVITMDTKYLNQVFYVWLTNLQITCPKYGLVTCYTPNDDNSNCLLDMKHGSIKVAFCFVYKKEWRKWCKFVSLSYLITLVVYLCSQWTPNVQIEYFIFDWSIDKTFVLNKAWNNDYLEMMIFVIICSTWSMVEYKRVLRTE